MSNVAQLSATAKLATSQAVVITAFHKDVFAAAIAGRKATETMQQKMASLLKSKYGETMPTFAQFKGDRAALKQLAADKGLADDQWVRKPFNAAVKALYGALPEAQTAAALAKRKVRDALGKSKAGAKKGETAPRRQSEPETLEQYITRVGVFKVLQQCALILECDDSTKDIGHSLKAINGVKW